MSLPETYKAIIGNEAGQPSLKEFPLPKPSTNQVLVKVEYAPINPTDIAKLKGFYGKPEDYATTLHGSEGSGIVVAVGNDLTLPYKVGDRVHIRSATWGQYMLADSEDLNRILQDDLSLEEAACHFVNPATVYYMGVLADRGNHKAAIHTAGSSALGRMLIRYFKHKGIKLINVVRREQYVKELLKDGADYVLNSTSENFEAQLKEIAEKENATLAFDAIAGDFTNKVLKSQPAGSECLVYGVLSGFEIKNIDIMELFKGKTIGPLFLLNYLTELGGKVEVAKFYDEVHAFLPTLLGSKIQKVYKLEDLNEAIAFYEENSSKGKILLKPN